MIISEQWLRDWVSVDLSAQEIADCLTHAGLEVDAVEKVAEPIDNLVVGKVLEVAKHPNADRLNLTAVDIGEQQLNIVCGAANVRAEMLVAVAMVGAKLPNGLKIKSAKVRGEVSNGMLCSAAELGLAESSEGIMELGEDAELGQRVDDYLMLDDSLIDIDLTPNRGDCLSVQGVARELKFLAAGELHPLDVSEIEASTDQQVSVQLENSDACPRYLGRVIGGIDPNATTPLWMAERLRRCGVRPISPVVDITNYVMLELGQPMHAFDRAKIEGGIIVRHARQGEKITLLDDSEATLNADTLVIADHQRPVAIAGVMGGADSAIGTETTDIVLEAAHFTRKGVAGQARAYGLHTDSSHRFERGVDPQLPGVAMQRATELVLAICGGQAGPVCTAQVNEHLGEHAAVELRHKKLDRLLGMSLPRAEVSKILQRIALRVQDTTTGWQVTPPSYRFDIEYEADLVEEVARVKGYDNIPTALPRLAPRSMAGSEQYVSARNVRSTLVARGYHEAITYSFIDTAEQQRFSTEAPVRLTNPLAENMSVMRTSLLPGLLNAARFNRNRQHNRIRLFELGATYHHADAQAQGANPDYLEKQTLAAVVSGPRYAQQWGMKHEKVVDFYDLKSDLEAVLSLTGFREPFIFNEFEHISMHPGQVCEIASPEHGILGVLGRLHPEVEQHYGFSNIFVFELDLSKALQAKLPAFSGVSKFPSIRRDLSLVVEAGLPVGSLLDCAKRSLGDVLRNVNIFDVYQGEGLDDGQKSVSLSLILHDKEKTLTDEVAEALTNKALDAMREQLKAELRS